MKPDLCSENHLNFSIRKVEEGTRAQEAFEHVRAENERGRVILVDDDETRYRANWMELNCDSESEMRALWKIRVHRDDLTRTVHRQQQQQQEEEENSNPLHVSGNSNQFILSPRAEEEKPTRRRRRPATEKRKEALKQIIKGMLLSSSSGADNDDDGGYLEKAFADEEQEEEDRQIEVERFLRAFERCDERRAREIINNVIPIEEVCEDVEFLNELFCSTEIEKEKANFARVPIEFVLRNVNLMWPRSPRIERIDEHKKAYIHTRHALTLLLLDRVRRRRRRQVADDDKWPTEINEVATTHVGGGDDDDGTKKTSVFDAAAVKERPNIWEMANNGLLAPCVMQTIGVLKRNGHLKYKARMFLGGVLLDIGFSKEEIAEFFTSFRSAAGGDERRRLDSLTRRSRNTFVHKSETTKVESYTAPCGFFIRTGVEEPLEGNTLGCPFQHTKNAGDLLSMLASDVFVGDIEDCVQIASSTRGDAKAQCCDAFARRHHHHQSTTTTTTMTVYNIETPLSWTYHAFLTKKKEGDDNNI